MKLHLDCSYTRLQAGDVGITRVVRGLARELPAVAPANTEVRLVAYHPSGFRRTGSAQTAPGRRATRRPPGKRLYALSGNVRVRRFIKSLIPVALQVAAWRLFSRLAFGRLSAALPEAGIRPGDVVIAGDAGWSYDLWDNTRRAAAQGARIVTIVYDLIPIHQPQFCAPVHRRLFEDWLLEALRCSDALLCISEATRAELGPLQRRQGVAMPAVGFLCARRRTAARARRAGAGPQPVSAERMLFPDRRQH